MAEVIDLVAYLRRRKLVAFLTEGVTIDLDEQMLEEFQYHLECFLTERHVDVTLLNDGQHNLEIQHLNQTFMTFHFLDSRNTLSIFWLVSTHHLDFLFKL